MIDWIISITMTVVQMWMSWNANISLTANLLLMGKAALLTVLFIFGSVMVLWPLFLIGSDFERVYKMRRATVDHWYDAFNGIQWAMITPHLLALGIVDIIIFRYIIALFWCPVSYFRFYRMVTYSKLLEAISTDTRLYDTKQYNFTKWQAKILINPFSADGKHINLPQEPGWMK